jgi:RimJ/RimL family protein N-acetyltransferase
MTSPGTFSGYQVTLRDITRDDLEMIRSWRNDRATRQFMLSQETISPEQQQAWFNGLQTDQCQQHWLILYRDKPIGVAYIKTLEVGERLDLPTRVEPGLYIADLDYRGNILAFAPTLLVNDYCFDKLGVRELQATVKASNSAALRYNEKLGYREIERHDGLVRIALGPEDYRVSAAPIKALLSRGGPR